VCDEHPFKDGYYYYIFSWTREILKEKKAAKKRLPKPSINEKTTTSSIIKYETSGAHIF
jgi:hypothetical protein